MSSKQAVNHEIELLNEERSKLQKGQTGKLVTGIVFLIAFFPIGIIVLIFYFINKSKISKIDEKIKDFEREMRLSATK